MALSYDDLSALAVLCAEKADDRSVAMPKRDEWCDRAQRIDNGRGTRADLRAAADLADEDATLQRDAKVRDRYLALAKRARDAA